MDLGQIRITFPEWIGTGRCSIFSTEAAKDNSKHEENGSTKTIEIEEDPPKETKDANASQEMPEEASQSMKESYQSILDEKDAVLKELSQQVIISPSI